MADRVIELAHLQKQFGDHLVLRDINLSVSKGEVLSIIGASGSGKSTMLRCINLLETPTSGNIFFSVYTVIYSIAQSNILKQKKLVHIT